MLMHLGRLSLPLDFAVNELFMEMDLFFIINRYMLSITSSIQLPSPIDKREAMNTFKKVVLIFGVLMTSMNVYAGCVGYSGPGGPCSTGPGGGLSTGPGGGLSTGPGGGMSTGPGGGCSNGPSNWRNPNCQ